MSIPPIIISQFYYKSLVFIVKLDNALSFFISSYLF